jgi:putative DNA primase/helicase
VNDTTIEKLGELLNENPNGLMLYRDEMNGFFKTINREDRSNDRAFYVEAFDGKSSYTFDRIGRGTIDIANVCMAMLGNIQPSVFNPYLMQAIKGGANDDGMIQRFQMMVYPDLVAWQNVDQWADKEAKDKAFSVFTRIASWDGFTEPARFSPDAQALFNEWYIRLNLELRSNDILPVMESHYGKYKSLIPSLAVLIHLADNTDHSQVIGISSVRRAIAWGVYLKSHAERVYSMALDPIDANAKTILNKIESGKLSDGFGTGDILRGGWSGLDSLENIKASLTRLMEYGWIKQLPIKPMSQGGRPAIRYQIHPKLL